MLVIRPLRNDVKRRISALQNRVARRRRLKIAAVLGALIAGLALLAGGYEYKAGAFRQELDSAIAAAESREDYETEVECLQMLINAYPHSIAAWKASKQMAAINEKKDLFYGKQIKLLTQSARTEEAEGRLDKALEVLQRLRDFTREQGVKQSAEDDMARIKAYLTEAEALWVLAEKYRRENRLKEVFEYNYKIYWEYPKSQRAREARLPLSIMSLPQGAGVYDGKLLLGPTPYVLYYPPARPPVLRISSPGFADVRYDVAQNLSPAFQDGWKVFLELTKPLHWRFRTQQPVEAPPAVHKDRLIFGSRDGYIYCVEDADGKLAWKTQLGAMADVVAQPLILNDRVYTGAFDGILYCLDAATGKAVWSVKVGGMLRSSPTASDDAALVFITSESGKIIAVNAETGDVKWTVNAGDVVSCAAVPYGGKVFAATKEGALLCLNQADGAEVWRINLGSGVSCAPAAADQKIYVGLWNGAMLCLSAENGKTLWKFDSRSAVRTAPVLAAGSLLFGNEDGWLFRLSLDDGRQIWQYRSRGAIHSAPEVVSDGKRVVFGCSDGSLYALDFADGAPQWKFHTDGPVDSRPLRNNGKIYFGSNDNSLYCIDE
jgi:outer membrane protein assembly factor BamB